MSKKAEGRGLRAIQGGYYYDMSHEPFQIVAAPAKKPPFKVDAVVVEEDTFLILSARPIVRLPQEPLIKVMTKVIETRPEEPGTVVVKGKRPKRFLAVVHDLNEEPTWKEEWVLNALIMVFQQAESRKFGAIALSLLATQHGTLTKKRFFELLRSVLEKVHPGHLKRIWLVIPSGVGIKDLDVFKSILKS